MVSLLQALQALDEVLGRAHEHRGRLGEQEVHVALLADERADGVHVLVGGLVCQRAVQVEDELEVAQGDVAGLGDGLLARGRAVRSGHVQPDVVARRDRDRIRVVLGVAVRVDALLEVVPAEVVLEADDADPALGGQAVRAHARGGDGDRGVRLVDGLGHDRPRRDVPEPAVVLDLVLREALHDDLQRLRPLLLGRRGIDAEGLECVGVVGPRGAQLGAPAGDDVERRDALGDEDGVVPGDEHAAHRPQRDPAGARRDRRIQHLGSGDREARRAEVLLGCAPGGEPELIGGDDLLDQLLVAPLIGVRVADPVSRDLPFLQQPDPHPLLLAE
jgi:hypothetical protein